MTVATLSTIWPTYLRLVRHGAGPHALRTDHGMWNNHILPFFGAGCKLNKITPEKILEFRGVLSTKNISPQTVRHILGLLRRVLNRAFEWRMIKAVPKFEIQKFDNKRDRFLSEDEVEQLLSVLKGRSRLWHDITVLCVHTGLRFGEMRNLRAHNFDESNRIIHVRDTKSCSNRSIPLNDKAYEILVLNKSKQEFIFMYNGKRLNRPGNSFWKAVEACGFNAGIMDRRHKVVFHTLRHTFASWLVQRGVHLLTVSKLLGHTSTEMTMRYSHLAPKQGRDAVDALLSLSKEPAAVPTKGTAEDQPTAQTPSEALNGLRMTFAQNLQPCSGCINRNLLFRSTFQSIVDPCFLCLQDVMDWPSGISLEWAALANSKSHSIPLRIRPHSAI